MVELLAVVRKKEGVFCRDYCRNFYVLFVCGLHGS